MPGPFSMSASSIKMDERSWTPSAVQQPQLHHPSTPIHQHHQQQQQQLHRHHHQQQQQQQQSPPNGGHSTGLDSQLWHACAGAMVHLPQVGSKVIYFPQGHAEHASSPPEFPRTLALSSTVLCRVVAVHFLADADTDEVYARIRLQPDPGAAADPSPDPPPSPSLPDKSASFAKTLTQSDANNGGGFSVPRYCAETIFPRLDYSEDPPVQIVHAKDVHGNVWKFRHIYRGTPRRHLLTTGWSNFVNQKKLVAGDAIVFLRSASGELCVGVRRSSRGTVGNGDTSSWNLSPGNAPSTPARPSRWDPKTTDNSYDFFGATDCNTRSLRTTPDMAVPTNFARNRSRVTAKSVLEAANLAAAGQQFEVVYYPRATISEFCVYAHSIRTALQQNWAPGMRFKMAVETEDASRISWFMGTIAKVQESDPVRWPNSPWKMLQVTWDEPDLLQGITRVSPWQIELVSPMQIPPFPLPKKKPRLSHPSELLEGQSIMGLPMAAFASNLLGQINPWHGFGDSVSSGMQGARHDQSFGLAISSDFRSRNPRPPISLWESFCKPQEHLHLSGSGGSKVSTDLSICNFSNDSLSNGHNQLSSLLKVGTCSSELTLSSNGSNQGRCITTMEKANSTSKNTPFVLFGKAIDTSHHSGGESMDSRGHESTSEGDSFDRTHIFLPSQLNHGKPYEGQKNASDPSYNEVGTLNWFKDQVSHFDKEKTVNSAEDFNHCKVFRESDEVGRTLDLSLFDSYEQLIEKLSLMFDIDKSEIESRVVYVDAAGLSRPVGDESYRDFAKRAKRLKIISESSSESVTR